ncbi:MAG: serine hydrolase domain-containing protein [Pontimonas sp.]
MVNDSLMGNPGVSVLDRLTNPAHPVPPRALIVNANGEPLWDSGDTTLPLALTGITKLFTLAMILREIDRGALSLDTTLGEVLPADTVRGLCVVGTDDHSFSITIENLLRHQSGIVDYMRPGRHSQRSLEQQFLEHDRPWTLDQALEIVRHYPGIHVPGQSSRAHLSSTNHLLLGAVLQETTGMNFEQLIQLRVVGSLGLSNTYVFSSEHFDKYFTLSPIHSGSRVIRIPQALASSCADGAIISTPQDTLTFSRAFWNGEIFRDSWLPQLGLGHAKCEKSLRMGLGMMVAPARRGKPPIVGYSGIAGCAVGVDVDKGHHAFLTTFQWSSPPSSFAAVASLLQSTRP